MYACLVPGGAAVAAGDLALEELLDLARLRDEVLERIRDRARLRRRGAHAQQSGREHKAQQQRQHSFFHMVPPSWNGHSGNNVYRVSIQDAPRFCNGSCAHGREKMHILFTQTQQNVTFKTFFLEIPIAHFPAYMVYFRQTGITVVHMHHNEGGRNDEKARALAGAVSGSGRGTVLRPDRERIGRQTRRSEKGDRREAHQGEDRAAQGGV